MKVRLEVLYYYIPHLDKPKYKGIEAGFYHINIRFYNDINDLNVSFYAPLHCPETIVDFCADLFLDPYRTEYNPTKLLRRIYETKAINSLWQINNPNLKDAECRMSVTYSSTYSEGDLKYTNNIHYYFLDMDSELDHRIDFLKELSEESDIYKYNKRIIDNMIAFVRCKDLETIMNKDFKFEPQEF